VYFKPNKFSLLVVILIGLASHLQVLRAQSNSALIDSLRNVLPESSGADRYDVLFNLFKATLGSDLESAKGYAFEANQVAIDLKDSARIVVSFNAIGYVIKEQGYPRLAIPYFEKGLVVARDRNYVNQVKYLLNNLGTSHERNANYAKALEYYLESLKLRVEEKDTIAISVALNNIGVLYEDLGDYENAQTYHKRNYDLHQKKKGLDEYELCLINLGEVSNALHQYEKAKDYLTQAFAFCGSNQQQCEKSALALAHNGFGVAYLNTGEFHQAEQEFQTSANLYSELKHPDRTMSYHSLALTRYRQGDYNGALTMLRIAQTLAEELEIPKYQLNNYRLFADTYAKLNDFKRSTDYQKRYIELNDEIYNADLIKNIALVQAEHQEEENLRTIAARDQELVSRNALLAIRNRESFYLWATIGLSALVLFLLVRNWYNGRRDKLKLERTVQDRTRQLFNTTEAYKKLNIELDHFIYKTSHDIQGPLRSLKGLISLAQIEKSYESIVTYLAKLDFTADRLNQILKRLQTVNDINTTTLTPEAINFTIMVDDILIAERSKGIPPRMKFIIDIDKRVLLKSNPFLLNIVLENLIDNAIKFHNDSDRIEPFMKFSVGQIGSFVLIKVTDNGIGFSNVRKEEVFKMFLRASERSQTGGIGLYLAKLCVEKLGGSIEMNTTPVEHYTEFTIKLPVDLQTVLDERAAIEREMEKERERLQKKTSYSVLKPGKAFSFLNKVN
jgi:signal transduction histidine kinase